MLFSNAQGSPDSPAIYEVATLLPVPEMSRLSMLVAGLMPLLVRVRMRGRRDAGIHAGGG